MVRNSLWTQIDNRSIFIRDLSSDLKRIGAQMKVKGKTRLQRCLLSYLLRLNFHNQTWPITFESTTWSLSVVFDGCVRAFRLTTTAARRSSWPSHLCWPWAATWGPAAHTLWTVHSAPSPPALLHRLARDLWPSGCSETSPRCRSIYCCCCFLTTVKEQMKHVKTI